MVLRDLILRLFTLHREGRLTACGLPANHPLVRFVQEPGSLDKALDLDDTVLWGSLSMLMDAEDELICLRARQLSERKLLKCMDIWSEAAVLLTPDKREDSAARSERVARISLTCDRVLERMAEVPGVLADDHKRDPYKRFQDSRTPPNQIHIMQDVEGHLCPPEHRSRDVSQNDLEPHLIAARLIEEAGGQLVGRTKLQKVACLATLAGFLDAFPFEYRHYGPFSERLAGSMEIATGLRIVEEKEERADWGSWYSIYRKTERTPVGHDADRRRFVARGAEIGPILLELATTAAFLNINEHLSGPEAWAETARRKPDAGRLEASKKAYKQLLSLTVPKPLPAIV